MYLKLRKAYRNYFWSKHWYKHLILYKLRQFLGMSYLKNGWNTKSETDYILDSLRRIEKKLAQ